MEDSKSESKPEKLEVENVELSNTENTEYDNLSNLSISSYDSLDKEKLESVGQYTCDECSLIPKIINWDPQTRTIIIKCEKHGQKNLDINNYVINSLNYNTSNWKCSNCEKVQRNFVEKFKYCQCKNIFCDECYNLHKEEDKENHKYFIESDVFNTRCKKNGTHFNEINKGFCLECNEHYCRQCEEEHKFHSNKKELNELTTEKKNIEKIGKLNQKYREFITYYESLIRLNNLIIYSFQNYKNNYYNLNNINTILNNCDRDRQIESLSSIESQAIVSKGSAFNFEDYMKKFTEEKLNDETMRIEIDNKLFNDNDLKIFSKISLKNLKMLVFENNSISNIDCFENSNFDNLVILNLNNNAINDISHFEKFKFSNQLQALFLRNNNIKDVSVFSKKKFDSLRELDLRENKIEDITIFGKWQEYLENLQCLYLTNNKFNKDQSKEAIEKINNLLDKEL